MTTRTYPYIALASAATLLIGLSAPQEANACSFGGPELSSVVWPQTPADGESLDRVDHPTNTAIWFYAVNFGEALDTTLIGPDGPVEIDVQNHTDNGNFAGTWIAIIPLQELAPETTYTVETHFTEENPFHDPNATDLLGSFNVTTGAGPVTVAPPTVENLRFIANAHAYGDDCNLFATSQRYFVAFDHAPTDEPYLYHLKLTFPDGTATDNPWPLEWHGVSHRSEEAERQHSGMIIAHSLDTDAIPCVTVSVENILGQIVAADTVCDPIACIEGQHESLFNSESWVEDPTSCDAMMIDEEPSTEEPSGDEPTGDDPSTGDEPSGEAPDDMSSGDDTGGEGSQDDDLASDQGDDAPKATGDESAEGGCTIAKPTGERSKAPILAIVALAAFVCLHRRRQR